MKKFLYPMMIVAAMLTFAACNNETTETVAVTGVTLSLESRAMEPGDEIALSATVAPADATNRSVTWSSNNNAVATVTQEGLVNAIAVGEAVITVTTVDGGHIDECRITVAEDVVAVTGVSLSVTETQTIVKGGEFTLSATVAPAEATNKNVVWDYDEEIVSVTEDPADATRTVVKGLKGGSTDITVSTEETGTDGQPFTASLTVVVEVPLTSISLSETSLEIFPDAVRQLTVVFEPQDATNKAFTFDIPAINAPDPQNPDESIMLTVATGAVDGTDPHVINITGKAVGRTAITVTAAAKGENNADIKAICPINVPQIATAFALDQTNVTIKALESVTLTPVFTPSNVSNQVVTWETTNSAVATVAGGRVTGVAEGGPVTITATTTDGSNLSASCTVYVEASDVEHPFGVIGFKSTNTWTSSNTAANWAGGGTNLVWSDYVTGTRCAGKTTLDTSDTNGDCMEGTKYHIISMAGMTKYKTILCPSPWRAPTTAEYQGLDLFFYPRTLTMGWSNGMGTSDEYVSKWGVEFGGYHTGSEVVGDGAETRIWTGDIPTTNQLRYIRLQSVSASREMNVTARSTSFGMAVRCVKEAN